MSNRRTKAAAPIAPETGAPEDDMVDMGSIDDDDDDDLWDDGHDHDELDDAGDPVGITKCLYCGCTEEHACSTADGPCSWIPGAEPVCTNPKCLRRHRAAGGLVPDDLLPPGDVAIADEFSAFVVATLSAKMKLKPLASQSNEWLLGTIGRVIDEISSARGTDRDDGDEVVDLELDLLKLNAAADVRGVGGKLLLPERAFIAGVAEKVEREEARDEIDRMLYPEETPASNASNLQIEYIPRDHIRPDPEQPRAHADAELKESIRASGILQPITVRRAIGVRGGYIIVDGERRWQGSADVLEVIPCIVRDDQEDEYTRLRTQLVANTGKALSPIEEAKAFARMLESHDVGVAGLARDIGRPPSSVNDRLKLLELGPWLPLIDNGTVSLSMAVEHLVPLRGIPDEYHAEAIAKMVEGLEPGEQIAEDVESFGHTVAHEYDKFMYPIAKSKQPYEKQPLFNTKAHDAECTCGGISWDGSWQGVQSKARKHCGNPAWWKPLHAAAKKEERAAAKESGGSTTPAKKGELRIELPAGTKTVSVGYGQTPKDVVKLTDQEGRWAVADRWIGSDLAEAFDPADLVVDDAKLVRLKQSYGLDTVGTRDTAAVAVAREKFAARFAPTRKKVGDKLVAEFLKLKDVYDVKGAGVHALLSDLDVSDLQFAEAADLLEIDVPAAVRKASTRDKTPASVDWFGKSLKRGDAEQLLSFFAFLLASEKRELPSAAVAKDMRAAVEEIHRKRAPWATTKAPKSAAKKGGKR